MAIYREYRYSWSLGFADILPDLETFEDWLEKLNWTIPKHEVLFELMALKYHQSTTRYQEEHSFMFAVKRELYFFWENFVKQMEEIERLRNLEIDEIKVVGRNLTNLVNNPTMPVTNPDKTPIPGLSTEQTSILDEIGLLEAVNAKYSALNKNNIQSLYRQLDPLFKSIIDADETWIYNQGGN